MTYRPLNEHWLAADRPHSSCGDNLDLVADQSGAQGLTLHKHSSQEAEGSSQAAAGSVRP
jgi:hypothetical protein